VIDGDTLQMGDMRFRLAGIDAPELEQICLRGSERRACGTEARQKLVALVRDRLVSCYNPDPEADNIRESHGRPVVSCKAQGGDGTSVDVAGYMIREGAAIPFGEEHGVAAPDYTSLTQQDKGVWTTCSLEPSVWRRDRAVRDAFLASGALPEAEGARLGACPRPVAPETQGVAAPPASTAGR
jgi:endonuclease YncB( thermonuclease family)